MTATQKKKMAAQKMAVAKKKAMMAKSKPAGQLDGHDAQSVGERRRRK